MNQPRADCPRCEGRGWIMVQRSDGIEAAEQCDCRTPDPRLPNFEQRIKHLLDQIGAPSECRACHARIYWVQHRNGKRAPYTPDGLNHFINCPRAAEFKRRRA